MTSSHFPGTVIAKDSVLLLAWIVLALCVSIGVLGGIVWLQNGRLDDLEARMITFETVRIEYVAPAKDSG